MVPDQIERALEAIRSSLQVDGFDLQVERFENGVISLVVLAGPQACRECLLPREHLQLRLEEKLKGIARAVRLRYPEIAAPSG
jgi:Fe-S cluster biogenesis protein NfuA